MKPKLILLNGIIFVGFTYIPLLIFSTIEYFSRPRRNLDLSMIIKKGYIPNIAPDDFFKTKELPKIYPIGSLPYQKIYLEEKGYNFVVYETDRFGLRNPDKKWLNINNKENTFIIGDSFVEGYTVENKSVVTSYIEKISKINTFNLGKGANDPYEYQALLKTFVKPILKKTSSKNNVVIFFYINDNINYNSKKENLINSAKSIVEFSDNNNQIKPNQEYISNFLSFVKNNFSLSPDKILEKRNNLKTFKNSSIYYIGTIYPIRYRLGLINLFLKKGPVSFSQSPSEKAILMLSDICEKSCKPYIVFIPEMYGKNKHKLYKLNLLNSAKINNIEFIDGEEILSENYKLNYNPNGHLSEIGYKKIANFIVKKFNK